MHLTHARPLLAAVARVGSWPVPLPRFQFSVRRLMVVVALVALAHPVGVEAIREWELARDYRWKAGWMAESERVEWQGAAAMDGPWSEMYLRDAQEAEEKGARFRAEGLARNAENCRSSAAYLRQYAAKMHAYAALARRKAGYYARLKRKYDRAAAYPWFPLPPDPPVPE